MLRGQLVQRFGRFHQMAQRLFGGFTGLQVMQADEGFAKLLLKLKLDASRLPGRCQGKPFFQFVGGAGEIDGRIPTHVGQAKAGTTLDKMELAAPLRCLAARDCLSGDPFIVATGRVPLELIQLQTCAAGEYQDECQAGGHGQRSWLYGGWMKRQTDGRRHGFEGENQFR
jgi:hypothetical protein